jgi:hypothetical protein
VCGARLDAEHVEPAARGFACTFCGALQDDTFGEQMRPLSLVDPAVEHLADVGPALHEAREELGRTIEEAARETRIRPRYLQALEDDESLDPYPGRIYRRFFLREYAEYLGLDPRPFLAATDADEDEGPVPLPPMREPRSPTRAWRFAGVVSLIVLVVLLGAWARSRATTSPTLPPAAGLPRVASGHPTDPGRHVLQPSGIHAVLTITARSYIAATVDGAQVHAPQSYLPPEILRYHGRHALDLLLGNAGGVVLSVNGRQIPTGSSGEVVHLSLSWHHGRMVVQRL